MKLYNQKWFPIAFIIVGLIIHLLGIGSFSIYILDEAKNAAAAMEMMQNQEWILPTFNGMPRYDKPPLHYYFFIVSYKIFGVNPFAARFFPALAGWFCFIIVYAFSAKSFGRRAGFFAGLALLSSFHWVVQFHLAVPDPFLILFLFLAIIYYERFVSSEFRLKYNLRLAALFLALATLSKGPVAIVLVGLTVLIFMLLDTKPFKHHYQAILDIKAWMLFLVVALPWYGLISWKTNGVWLKEFIFQHNLNRFSAPMEGHGGSFYITILFVFLGFLPGALVIFSAIKKAFFYHRLPAIISLSIIFTFVTLIFFMFSGTKLPNYTAPIYPLFALIIGWYFGVEQAQRFKWPSYFSSLLILILPVALYLSFKRIEVKEIDTISVLFSIPAFIGLLALVSAISRKWELAWITSSLGFVSFTLIFLLQVFPSMDRKNPVLNSEIIWRENTGVFHFGSFNPAFIFKMNRPIPAVETHISQLKRGDLILTNKKSLPDFKELEVESTQVFEGVDLFENSETIILRIE